jgi:cytoskeletal protein RodZ
MALLFLEALGAGLIFIAIIWWTMFSGRTRGELRQDTPDSETAASTEKTNKK